MSQLIKLLREERTELRYVFCVGPFGVKELSSGPCNFDSLYTHVLEPTIKACGMRPVRADGIYGTQGVIDTVWRGCQKAEVVIVDFTGRSPNVAAEFVMALVLGKRIIVITQDPDDIPSDVRGLYRYIPYKSDFESIDKLKEQLTLQVEAIRKEPATEMILVPDPSGATQPVSARVVIVDREFVLVETEDGRRGVLGNADVDYSRIVNDMARKFSVGDRVSGAFDVDFTGQAKYTLLTGQTNPWPLVTAEYPPGRRFTGTVQNVVDKIGAFVRIGHGINGLIPESELAGRRVSRGGEVDVLIDRIDADHRRVTLRLDRAVPAARTPSGSSGALPAVGLQTWGEVIKAVPEAAGTGGYLLLRLPGYDTPALLHCTKMTQELRADLNHNEIEAAEEIFVKVSRIDTTRGRVSLEELPEPEERNEQLDAA
jgi:small subunit ribosomal protein S1